MGFGDIQEASWLEWELTNLISILTELVCVMCVTIPIFVFLAIPVCTYSENGVIIGLVCCFAPYSTARVISRAVMVIEW